MNLNTDFFSFLLKRLLFSIILFICFNLTGSAQAKYKPASWWFGVTGAANFNFYNGTTYRLNEVTNVSTPFGHGFGVGVFGGGLIEYHRPNTRLGLMLQEGFDNRRATFKQADDRFYAHLTYFSIEPSLRLAPFRSNFYLYGGPRFGLLLSSSLKYTRSGRTDYPDRSANPDAKAYISAVQKNPVSMQVGAGYDFHLHVKNSSAQFVVSPFVTYFPTMWRKNIRSVDRLYLSTVRTGLAVKIGRGKKIMPVVPPIPPVTDRDGDGVVDSLDKCPDVAGLATLQGCPDRDGDGIMDSQDECPDVAGLMRYRGCPVPDRDKDGINDEVDKCPDVAGLPRYQGCPIPDTDGDAVNDEEDKCINEKGPASNFGCPVISPEIIKRVALAAKNVFFATASDRLLSQSNKRLDDVVAVLNENPSFMIQIDGHTDDQGNDEYNLDLSNKRAASVKAYLAGKGIAEGRLNSTGYGETKPVADNKTAAGRAQNRRVEMTLRNY